MIKGCKCMKDKQEILLTDWFRRARESQMIHYECGSHYERWNYLLGVPAMILSAVVGTAVFTSLDATDIGNYKILIGLISMLATIVTALHTFLGYAQRSEKHKAAAAGYSSIRKTLERIKTTPENYAENFDNEMAVMQSEFDNLATSSPSVPESIGKNVIQKLKSTPHNRIFNIPAK
jgi:hypothetical protein